MVKDLMIIDTSCYLNKSIAKIFEGKGYEVGHVHEPRQHLRDDTLEKANGWTAICIFINKKIWPGQVEKLKSNGNKLILCCSAGFDNLPLEKLKEAGIRVARVPSYSPSSIAEYAISSILALAKNLQKSYEMTKNADFTIGGLQCILVEDKSAGIIGTGLIGKKTATKISSLVKEVLCYDAYPDANWISTLPNARYVPLEELLTHSDFISIHVPLLDSTKHLINEENIGKCKKNLILINTSRGEIVKTDDLVQGLKSGKIFGCALDVFEGERAFIFKDMSDSKFADCPHLDELSQMSNVIISSHLAFYTDESIRQISECTLDNFLRFTGKLDMDEKYFVA